MGDREETCVMVGDTAAVATSQYPVSSDEKEKDDGGGLRFSSHVSDVRGEA